MLQTNCKCMIGLRCPLAWTPNMIYLAVTTAGWMLHMGKLHVHCCSGLSPKP